MSDLTDEELSALAEVARAYVQLAPHFAAINSALLKLAPAEVPPLDGRSRRAFVERR